MAWMKIRPQSIRYLSLGAALFSSLPIPSGAASGIYLWMSPLILLSSIFALKGPSLLNLAGLAILVASFLKERWFCRYLCPTGALCELSAKSLRRRPAGASFPAVNRTLAVSTLAISLFGIPLLAVLDPVNAFYNFFRAAGGEFSTLILLNLSGLLLILIMSAIFPSLWCSRICPLGGLQLLLSDLRSSLGRFYGTSSPRRPGRRVFLAALLGGGAGLVLVKLAPRFRAATAFRPPGALTDGNIDFVCLRCGNCISACPTGIIKASTDPEDLPGLMTPVLDFNESYCLPECTACGDVCPSGAIRSLDQDEKRGIFIAAAALDLEKCFLTHNRECNRCRSACVYDAIRISRARDGMAFLPEIDPGRCVGCAACRVACPPEAIRMIPPTAGKS